ncbi:hypothetical protein [Winogradskyella sp.]|uniref:hypothetical protein n=1 Tax=Winogradskyella sp. TaxID=1883156 RepID=UPI002619BB0D|nr:hypothetical protein [Winogradskyella sp.]
MLFYSKNSKAISLDEIRIELIQLISNQLSQTRNQNELLLWINETNSYVSCHWYDSEKGITDDSDNYSVVEFDELQDLELEDIDGFYEKILNALKTFSSDTFKNQNIDNASIYESDEIDEPTKIIEIEKGSLKIIESTKEDWKNNLIKEIENNEILTEEFKKKKLILWLIRTIIAVILYIIFWKYEWVRWSLLIYIPLNLFSLLSIFFWRNLIGKKLSKIKNK